MIGTAGAGTKRGAVNIDGYDSDSDNEGFDARAEERAKSKRKKKGDVGWEEAMEGYDKNSGGRGGGMDVDEEEDENDMFADLEEEVEGEGSDVEDGIKAKRKGKQVQFLDVDEIEGQVLSSKSGGHVSSNFSLDPKGKLSTHAMDDNMSSDDEEDAALAAAEEGIDDEVGLGGLKRNAPKVDAFNMKAEQEEGRFDDAGNFVRKAQDPDAKHDIWLEGLSKKDMKKAAEAHEKREVERREKQRADDALLLPDILKDLIIQLEKGETVLEALARLGKGQAKTKKVPKWKLKKQQKKDDSMDVDATTSSSLHATSDPEQTRITASIDAITASADQLLSRGQTEIYEQEREMLIRQYQRETGEQWIEPARKEEDDDGDVGKKTWEYRWIDGRDGGKKEGPYDGTTMEAWSDAGYFGEGVEFRRVGEEGWSRVVDFV